MNSNDYNYENWKTEAKEFWEKSQENINEDEIVKKCVRLAFRDLTVRTMKSKKDIDKPVVLDELAIDCCQEKVAGKTYLKLIKDWLEGCEELPENRFLSLHDDLCNIVIKCLKKKYEDDYCTYGKAQKIVNMTFKYLYAYHCSKDDSSSWSEESFKFCHMPLDSFTLEWFGRKIPNVTKGKIGAWSNIQKKEKNNRKSYEYEFYQERIKTYFETYYAKEGITPLRAEFVIWPSIQKELAVETFIFTFKPITEVSKRQDVRKESLDDKIRCVKELVKKM